MNDFAAGQVTRSHTLRINGRPDDVFGLFDPIGEKKWSKDWNPIMIFPPSDIRQGAVFVTRDNDETETIWIITTLDRTTDSIGIPRSHRISRSVSLTSDVNRMASIVPKLV